MQTFLSFCLKADDSFIVNNIVTEPQCILIELQSIHTFFLSFLVQMTQFHTKFHTYNRPSI